MRKCFKKIFFHCLRRKGGRLLFSRWRSERIRCCKYWNIRTNCFSCLTCQKVVALFICLFIYLFIIFYFFFFFVRWFPTCDVRLGRRWATLKKKRKERKERKENAADLQTIMSKMWRDARAFPAKQSADIFMLVVSDESSTSEIPLHLYTSPSEQTRLVKIMPADKTF